MTEQQDTPPAVELLPCPFCAGEAELADVVPAYYVMCSVDGCWANSCVSLWRDRSEAIAAWNTRPAERTARPDGVGDGWQSIESAPKDGTDLLAYEGFGSPDLKGAYYHIAWYGDEDDGAWTSRCGQYVTQMPEPTHWMPLPPPPGSEIADAALGPKTASDDAAGEVA